MFTRDEVSLREGDYPSCEAAYWGSEEAVTAVFKGESSLYAGVRTAGLKVYGSLNEAVRFEGLL